MEAILVLKTLVARNSGSSSESSYETESETDELYAITRLENESHTVCRYYEDVIPTYTLDEFKSHFRISRSSVEAVIQNIKTDYFKSGPGKTPIHIEKALLMTIWTLSNEECFRSVADRFGLRKGSAHTIVLRMCKVLCKNIDKYIVWPKGVKAITNIENFNNLRGEGGFPNVFGCIDGSHILIPSPGDNSYYDRKGNYSLKVQGICDSSKKFINVSCGWPGSFHDARVWKESVIYKKLMQDSSNWLPAGSYLLGDSAYPLSTFLITPFRDNGNLSPQQKLFNRKLSSTRVVIEHAFGRLKGLFRRLRYLNVVKITYAKYIILSCCILHNIAIDDNTVCDIGDEEHTFDDFGNEYSHESDSGPSELRNSIMQRIC